MASTPFTSLEPVPPGHHRRGRRPFRIALAALFGSALVGLPASGAAGSTPAEDADPAPAGVSESAHAQQSAAGQQLPDSFAWFSSGPLISPKPDAENDAVAVKDPSVIRHDGRWHVYMTTPDTSGDWSLAHTSFTDWSDADQAPHTYLETESAIGQGYRAAPQVFYFEPDDEWYLVYQTGLPSFSTTDDPGDPTSWSAPRNFQDERPAIVDENIGDGYWVDFWVICDDTMCYLYSADDNGHLYRAETTKEEFPQGFDNTQIVLSDDRNDLFEGDAVYQVEGTDTYLLIMEAIGSDGRRYYRSFTSQGLDGNWEPLAASEQNPFARSNNVTFPGGAWTEDISHGELVRTSPDQDMTIDPNNLQLVYQGMDPSADGDYSQLPWRLGLATQTNSPC